VISNLTQKVQEVFISAKQMVGMNDNTGRSSDKAGCEAFRSELWQTALKIQGPKLMDAEYSSGLWPVVTKQVKGAFNTTYNTTKGAFNSTAEWIKNKAPTTGTQDNKQQTSDDSKSIWVQGKEGIQSGIESAKDVLGLKPTPTVSPTDKAMENFGKEKPVDDAKDQQSQGVISKVTTQVQSAVNSAKEWVRVQSSPDPFDSSSKSILQQGKEGIQSGVEKAKDLMGIKPEVGPQKMSPEMQETIDHNQGVITGSSEHI